MIKNRIQLLEEREGKKERRKETEKRQADCDEYLLTVIYSLWNVQSSALGDCTSIKADSQITYGAHAVPCRAHAVPLSV